MHITKNDLICTRQVNLSLYDSKITKTLGEGIYNIENIEFEFVWPGDESKIDAWLTSHDTLIIGSAYGVSCVVLLSDIPQELSNDDTCYGYIAEGACAVLKNTPKNILILAQND